MSDLLCIFGPNGSGKTRLLQMIEQVVVSAPGGKVLRVGVEMFADELVRALHVSAIESFRRKYHEIDTLLIDNLWVLCSRPHTTTEICGVIQKRRNAGRLTAVVSDLLPEEWAVRNNKIYALLQSGQRIVAKDFQFLMDSPFTA